MDASDLFVIEYLVTQLVKRFSTIHVALRFTHRFVDEKLIVQLDVHSFNLAPDLLFQLCGF